MAFEGYTQETLDFLWGIRFNNERSWFLAHKQDYEAHLLAPTRALGEQVYEALHAAFPKEPFLLKLSRIYRDARRLHGNGPYKDHLWFCVRAGGEDWTGRPTFYFEIGPDYYSYGMGFWAPKAALMEAYRKASTSIPRCWKSWSKGSINRRNSRFQARNMPGKRPPPLPCWRRGTTRSLLIYSMTPRRTSVCSRRNWHRISLRASGH